MDAPGERPSPTTDQNGARSSSNKEHSDRTLTPAPVKSDELEFEETSPGATPTRISATSERADQRPSVSVSCPISNDLTPAAKLKYVVAIRSFSVLLNNEIDRQELGARGDSEGPAEVDVRMVEVAYDNVRHSDILDANSDKSGSNAKSRSSKLLIFCPVIATLCTTVAGIFGNNLPATWAWVFLFVFSLGTVLAMIWPFYEVRRRS